MSRARSRRPSAPDSDALIGSEPPLMQALDPSIALRFGGEAEQCAALLSAGIVELETETPSAERWEEMMRAAHSLKGSARVVGLMQVGTLAHTLEDHFIATRTSGQPLVGDEVDLLLEACDLFQSAGRAVAAAETWTMVQVEESARALGAQLLASKRLEGRSPREPEPALGVLHLFDNDNDNDNAVGVGQAEPEVHSVEIVDSRRPPSTALSRVPAARHASAHPAPAAEAPGTTIHIPAPAPRAAAPAPAPTAGERVLRVAAESIDRLMGLAGESLVESRRVAALSTSLMRLKREQSALVQALSELERKGSNGGELREVVDRARALGRLLGDHQTDFDDYVRRVEHLGERLYREALKTRMRPFSDGTQGLARLVRDVSRKLGKRARLTMLGEHTEVDRDVLENLDAPLSHILRNALDHGVEAPAERSERNKPELAELRVEARHHAGMLRLTVTDDGRGIDPEKLRRKVLEKGLVDPDTAQALDEAELFEFLFLPGFSTAAAVSEISGRGVGLDVVRTSVEALDGSVRVQSRVGEGTTFELTLPVTRSVVRALVAEVDGDAFAFPLLRIERIDRIARREVGTLEGQRYVVMNDKPLALVDARRVLGFAPARDEQRQLNVVVVSDRGQRFGIVVDDFRGEHDLVVRPLDTRLGKVENLSAAAVLIDGSTALIVDVDDMVRSIERLIRSGELVEAAGEGARVAKKRILVVDDSITVREAERQVLANRGFDVDVAVDGYEGLHAARRTSYDLIVTDIDMPRMNGLELVRTLKEDTRTRAVPVIVVSYKNREEDRAAGLAAGADAYLSKSSFHDARLLEVVDRLLAATP